MICLSLFYLIPYPLLLTGEGEYTAQNLNEYYSSKYLHHDPFTFDVARTGQHPALR